MRLLLLDEPTPRRSTSTTKQFVLELIEHGGSLVVVPVRPSTDPADPT